MIIAAFDLGSRMGFAAQGPARIVAGTLPLATDGQLKEAKKTRADRRLDIRVVHFFEWLDSFFKAWGPKTVVFEDVQFAKSQAQAHLWASYRGALWAACIQHRIPRVDCLATGKLKIFATGNGHADKDQMAAALLRREPNEFSAAPGGLLQKSSGNVLDDNAVDAYLLLRWAQSVYR